MRIHFTASVRGKKLYGEIYKRIYSHITKLGHKHVDDWLLKTSAEDYYSGTSRDQEDAFKYTMDRIKLADVVVLEISTQSLSIGFIIEKALEEGRPVVALYKAGVTPFFIEGIKNDRLQFVSYDKDNLEKNLEYALEDAKEQMDVRFNFFVSPKIVNYLDWIAKKERMPRAVYLRKLIEQDMNVNKKYVKADD